MTSVDMLASAGVVPGPDRSSCSVPVCRSPLGHLVSAASRDIDQVVGDHAQADPAVHAGGAVVAAPPQAVLAFQDADAAFGSGAPRCPRRNQRWRSCRPRASDFPPRTGKTTRRTPRVSAACSFRAEANPRFAADVFPVDGSVCGSSS